jgi:hypothetical protein
MTLIYLSLKYLYQSRFTVHELLTVIQSRKPHIDRINSSGNIFIPVSFFFFFFSFFRFFFCFFLFFFLDKKNEETGSHNFKKKKKHKKKRRRRMSVSEHGIWISDDGKWTDRLPRCKSCWFCGLDIKTDIPCYMPVRYVEGKWTVRGEFCDLSCLVSYILHHLSSPILHLKMFYKLYGKNNLEGISVYPLHHYLPHYIQMTSPITDGGFVYHTVEGVCFIFDNNMRQRDLEQSVPISMLV